MRVTRSFGLLLSILCDPVQEGENPFHGNFLQVLSPEFLTEFCKNQFVCLIEFCFE
jgi:hypothetical protein